MKYCSKHHANPDNALFCNECGEELAQTKRQGKKCPKCGTENPNDAEFCHACGWRLTQTAKSSQQSSSKSTSNSHKPSEEKSSSYSDGIVKRINASFVFNYRITETHLLGKVCMWACTLLSALSIYGFINCCIYESGWGLVQLATILSYVGICYQKSLGAIIWIISIFIKLIGDLYFLFKILDNDLLNVYLDQQPLSPIIIILHCVCFAIVAHRLYQKRNSCFWE